MPDHLRHDDSVLARLQLIVKHANTSKAEKIMGEKTAPLASPQDGAPTLCGLTVEPSRFSVAPKRLLASPQNGPANCPHCLEREETTRRQKNIVTVYPLR